MRKVYATRYVTPLREGGSMPAIVEADDSGLYVLKFRGAGQGPLALVAELVAGEIGRALGLKVPELVLVDVDQALGRNEGDPEIQSLLSASIGLNLALDYLPGSVMFDRAAKDRTEPGLASDIVWFDSFVTNVDRTARNPNMLIWHKAVYLIDHGAALYFHHDWRGVERAALSPFLPVRDHVLLQWADELGQADQRLRPRLGIALFERILNEVPAAWLLPEPGVDSPEEKRQGYVNYLEARLAASHLFVEEGIRARAQLV